MRADKYVANALNISRNKASELIKGGKILLGSELLQKVSQEIDSGEISVLGEIYVSRAALKLKEFLKENNLDIKGANAIDIGSSTGGFAQILLEFGASSVTCVDVGDNQLSEILRNNSRIKLHENTDIRDFRSDKFYDIITCDVSFISLNFIIDCLKNFDFKTFIVLFKPQFEVGIKAKRNKSGVVTDEKAVHLARSHFEARAGENGLNFILTSESKIKGKDGNTEYFYMFEKGKR